MPRRGVQWSQDVKGRVPSQFGEIANDRHVRFSEHAPVKGGFFVAKNGCRCLLDFNKSQEKA